MGASKFGLMALLTELGALQALLVVEHADQALLAYLAIHAPASGLLALAVYLLIPARQSKPRASVAIRRGCWIRCGATCASHPPASSCTTRADRWPTTTRRCTH